MPVAIPAPHRLMPIERLIPYARNPRTHTDEQVAQIAASMVDQSGRHARGGAGRCLPKMRRTVRDMGGGWL
jgi:hypothetical protein